MLLFLVTIGVGLHLLNKHTNNVFVIDVGEFYNSLK